MSLEGALLVAVVVYCTVAYLLAWWVWVRPALRALEAEARLTGYRVPAPYVFSLGVAYLIAPLWVWIAFVRAPWRVIRERWSL